jgi:hypothetical protein
VKPRGEVSSESLARGGASTRGEGASPTAKREHLGGGEGQESIGSSGCLTAEARVRTLGRSKALKSQALACSEAAPDGQSRTVRPRRAHRVQRPVSGFGRSLVVELLRWFDDRADAETGCPGRPVGHRGSERGERGQEGAVEGRGGSSSRACSARAEASRNGKRATGIERCHGWPSGKSSEGR